MTPEARQCGPPELFATLPPTVHACWLDGSGAKRSPNGASCRFRSRLITPGSTHATRAASSIDRTRSIFVVTMTTGSPTRGGAAGEAGARSAGDERATVPAGGPHAGLHLGGVEREADDRGVAADVRRVPLVQGSLQRAVAHAVRRERRPEVGDECLAQPVPPRDMSSMPSGP